MSDTSVAEVNVESLKHVGELNARDILYMSRRDTWMLQNGRYFVNYEDGKRVSTTKNAIITDRCFWELYLLYPETPLLSTITYEALPKESFYHGSLIRTYLDMLVKYICEFNNLRTYASKIAPYVSGRVDKSFSIEGTFDLRYKYPESFAHLPPTGRPLLERTFIVENIFFNEVVHGASPYVASADALDFIEIVDNPDVIKIHSEFEPSPDSVDSSYRAIGDWVKNSTINNTVVDSVRCGAARITQFNQCVGPRGFVADLNRAVFAVPIQNGYIKGIPTLDGMMSESRTAAKALNAAGDSIRKSEYASRRFQLLTMSVERYIDGDCGSNTYMDVVMNDRYLKNFIGKWYLDEESNTLLDIKGDEEHLIGETIKVRTIFGCLLENRHHVCSRCLGRITENFKENGNLGQRTSQELMQNVTQNLLSFKHEVKSVGGSGLSNMFDGEAYFYGNDLSQLFLHDIPRLKELSVILNGKDLYRLVDVLSVDDVDIPMGNLGGLETVGFRNNLGVNFDVVTIASPDMPAILSRDFLEHIKASNLEVNEDGNYIVPLKGWDVKYPLFEIPLKEVDMNRVITKMEKIIEGTIEKRLTLKEHFFRLTDMILERSNCNIAILEVMTYAISAFNLADGNLRLGRGSPDMQYAKRDEIFNSRSISQFLIFERQMQSIRSKPHVVCDVKYRQRHPMDVVINPQEVVDAYKKELKEIEVVKSQIAFKD